MTVKFFNELLNQIRIENGIGWANARSRTNCRTPRDCLPQLRRGQSGKLASLTPKLKISDLEYNKLAPNAESKFLQKGGRCLASKNQTITFECENH
jgi:hypothetical protein